MSAYHADGALLRDPEPLDRVLVPEDLGAAIEAAPRLGVDTWIGRVTEVGVELLLLLRSEVEGGFWQGVSGTVEGTDRTLRSAAAREIREETGLDIRGEALLDLGRWIRFRTAVSGVHYIKRSMGLALPPAITVSDIVLSEEHVEARIVPEAEALGMVRWPENRQEIVAFARRLLS